MKKSVFKKLVLVTAMMASAASFADTEQPSHGCTKPVKPVKFANQQQVDEFNQSVTQYQHCIRNFIDAQKIELQRHSQAIDQAIGDWNSFVEQDLNS